MVVPFTDIGNKKEELSLVSKKGTSVVGAEELSAKYPSGVIHESR